MIPHVTQFDEADITELEAFRAQGERGERQGRHQGHAARLPHQGGGRGAEEIPRPSTARSTATTSSSSSTGTSASRPTRPTASMVPVVKEADQKGVIEIAKETSELAAKAREGKLAPADMQGGTFSISSLGGIGGTAFTPIVNAPEVAILGVSKAAMKPVWNGKEFAAAADDAAVAFVRPPRGRRRARRALHHPPRPGHRRPAPRACSRRAMAAIEIKVPDIGDFTDIPVLEILVKAGRHGEEGRLAASRWRATRRRWRCPRRTRARCKEVRVKVGRQGLAGHDDRRCSKRGRARQPRRAAAGKRPQPQPRSPSATAAAAAPAAPPSPGAARGCTAARPCARRSPPRSRASMPTCTPKCWCSAPAPAATPPPSAPPTSARRSCWSSATPTLGGVCLNVGCIPSKALLHAAKVITEAEEGAHIGITFGEPKIELDGCASSRTAWSASSPRASPASPRRAR